MNLLQASLTHPLVTALGWALIHSVWQGAILALMLGGVLRVLRDRSTNARYAAACAGPALDTLKHASPGEQAAIALAALSRPAVEPLIAAIGSGNPTVRRNAAWAIGEVTGVSVGGRYAAVEPLVGALRDSDPWVRLAAAFSLGELRPRSATDALVNALNDAEWNVREMVVRPLGEMKTHSGVESLTAVLLRDENERVRRKAAWALGEIKDPLALNALSAGLTDQDQRVRKTARRAISEIVD